jgi:hypothetical protein
MYASGKKSNSLPSNLIHGIEQLSGINLSSTKVHYDSDKPAQVQAHAYAEDNNIFVASGQENSLSHEAWHVVQQEQGRVSATTEVNGHAINDNASLEQEADVMGSQAMDIGNSSLGT